MALLRRPARDYELALHTVTKCWTELTAWQSCDFYHQAPARPRTARYQWQIGLNKLNLGASLLQQINTWKISASPVLGCDGHFKMVQFAKPHVKILSSPSLKGRPSCRSEGWRVAEVRWQKHVWQCSAGTAHPMSPSPLKGRHQVRQAASTRTKGSGTSTTAPHSHNFI